MPASLPPDPSSAASAPSLLWSGMTHCGRVRPNNEDSFLALTFSGSEIRYLGKIGEATFQHGDFVFAVSDGMGGAKSGEFASKITVEKISRLLPRSFHLLAQGMGGDYADVLVELFEAVHRDLIKLGCSYEECRGMGTTLSLCWFSPNWMHFAHAGDSRIYYLPRDGGLRQLSDDHTHVGWLRRQGRITEREARSHPMRNNLHLSLGAGHQFVEPQVGAVGYEPGDRFLICSDGLIDGLWDRHLDEFIRHPEPPSDRLPPAQRLVEESLERSGRDNTTALVIECVSPGPVPAP
ncbi:MAG: protein phosphatase 2C domain-containing protein [Opitutaceae bacterium]|nr:protein phosphatase 2C domain-containing protein [Opitutaceae bacterium]